MSNIVHTSFPKYNNLTTKDTESSSGSSGDNAGGGGMLEARVAKLESDVINIKENIKDIKEDIKSSKVDLNSLKIDVAVIKSNYATKEDVVKSANKIIYWVVGAVFFFQLLPVMPKIYQAILKLIS
ncbi:MAG TPA: hypothetical protein ACHBX6_10695 [Arsenophonus nasoniae]|uniref:hypothetical protein n=1 Tax=Arsenophonus nasoniae TaxID=638 RepID=UPI0038793137